jgi:hypothetical protein
MRIDKKHLKQYIELIIINSILHNINYSSYKIQLLKINIYI